MSWKRTAFLLWFLFGALAFASDPAAGGSQASGGGGVVTKVKQFTTANLPACNATSNLGLPVWDTTVNAAKVCQGAQGWVTFAQSQSYFARWDTEASLTPRLGVFTQFTESGISGVAPSLNTSETNAFNLTQTSGDPSWGKVWGYVSNVPGVNDYTVRASIRKKGPGGTDAVDRFCIGARAVVTASVYAGWLLCDLSGTIYLNKKVGGVTTTYANTALSNLLPGITAPDSLYMQLDVVGSYVTASLNGVTLWRTFDASVGSAGAGAFMTEPAAAGQAQAILRMNSFDVITRGPDSFAR